MQSWSMAHLGTSAASLEASVGSCSIKAFKTWAEIPSLSGAICLRDLVLYFKYPLTLHSPGCEVGWQSLFKWTNVLLL